MINYCTYFNVNYLVRGLALYESLLRHSPPFRIYVLCMDELVREILQELKLPHIELVALAELERADPGLVSVKENRSRIEYYFTCSPCWPLYLMQWLDAGDSLHYVDADLFFFASPEPILQELAAESILIVEHRFPESLKHLELYGIFNVGWLSFRKSAVGLRCLSWWRERCLEWCRDFAEDGKFADQKYLDEWPTRFPGTVVLRNKGAGIAPWNISEQTLKMRNDVLEVQEGIPLIFYHFHKFKPLTRWLFDLALDYEADFPREARRLVYHPYILELKRQVTRVRAIRPDFRLVTPSLRGRKHRSPLALMKLLARGGLMIVP